MSYEPFSPLWMGAALGGALAGTGALSLALSKTLQKRMIPSWREDCLADHIPLQAIDLDEQTVWCKNGTPCQVITLQGVLGEALTASQEQTLFQGRLKWLKELAQQGTHFNVLTLRQEVPQSLPGTYDHPVLQTLHERWMASFQQSYANSHYLMLWGDHRKTGSGGRKIFSKLGKKYISSRRSPSQALSGKSPWVPLSEAVALTLESLQPLRPRVLNNQGPMSELMAFWSHLIHGDSRSMKPLTTHLSDHLVGARLSFDNHKGQILWQEGEKTWRGAIISLNRWDQEISSSLMKALMALPGRFIALQQLQGIPKLKALLYLMDQKKQTSLAFASATTLEAFEAAIEVITTDESALYAYQCSFFLIAETEEELLALITATRQVFRQYGLVPIQETRALEAVWHSLFPGSKTLLRPTYLLAHNVAHLLTFPQEATGLTRSDWGPGPLRLFKTASHTVYGLDLHISEDKEALANSLVIAPAGSGKTTLFQHLIGGALRHRDLKVYLFDRFQGMKIFTDSVGGTTLDISAGTLPLNPFLGPDTPQERAFLCHFLQLLSELTTPESFEETMQAINILYRVPSHLRVLTHLMEGLFSPYSELKKRLQPWVGEGIYSHWFNGIRDGEAFDALSLEQGYLFNFEMTGVQASLLTAAAMTTYLMHRIRASLRQTASPHLIFIDETAPMLKHPLFRDTVEVLFKEHRKLRGSINVCFQTVKDVLETGLASVILEQCPTRFFFPNPASKREDYALFDLSETEWAYIKGESPLTQRLKHSVLVKRFHESVILNTDMSPLGPYLKLYKSGAEAVNLVTTLQQQWGHQWIDPYLQSV